MRKEGIIIRKVEPSDFDGLVRLYEDVWPDVKYNKKQKANFVLNESTGIRYCAELNGEIVGSRTSFSLNFYYGKRKLNCLQVGDSCTRQDCRGKGLFGKMNKALLEDFFEKSMGELIWNISVPDSRRVYERLGWKYIKSLATLVKFCRPFSIIRKVGFNISSLLGPVDWELTDGDIFMDDNLLSKRIEEFQKSNLLYVNYDNNTIQWRLKSHSGIKSFYSKDNGLILYKLGYKHGVSIALIGEIFAQDYSRKCVKQLLKEFEKDIKTDLIKVAVSLGHPMLPYYKKSGFFFNPRNKYLNHGVRVKSDEMKEICYNPNNWAISMLDVDTF